MITIEREVPMPQRCRTTTRKYRYPWRQMQIGESFVFPPDAYSQNLASVAGQRTGRVFQVRQMSDGSHRCWRTA